MEQFRIKFSTAATCLLNTNHRLGLSASPVRDLTEQRIVQAIYVNCILVLDISTAILPPLNGIPYVPLAYPEFP